MADEAHKADRVKQQHKPGSGSCEVSPEDVLQANAALERLSVLLKGREAGGVSAAGGPVRMALLDQRTRDFQSFELPWPAVSALMEALKLLAAGDNPVVMGRRGTLSTQEVADFLEVSRPFVVRQIEAGRMGCVRVGSHRRVALSEAIRFRASMHSDPLRAASLGAQASAGQAPQRELLGQFSGELTRLARVLDGSDESGPSEGSGRHS